MLNTRENWERFLADEQAKRDKQRLEEPFIRLWDGNWQLIGVAEQVIEQHFEWLMYKPGSGALVVPADSAVGEVLGDPEQWPTDNIYVTVDARGERWSGRCTGVETRYESRKGGGVTVELSFIHDLVKLKELYCYPNPFLPPEAQFPKAWMLFGSSKWCVAMTILVNIIRHEGSLWKLPPDPLDIREWASLDSQNWRMAIKNVNILPGDPTPLTTIVSRFGTVLDAVTPTLEDAQLMLVCRRYLPGDPIPIPGVRLRHGCLVWEVVDRSGWYSGTGLFGDMRAGITRGLARIGADGLTETIDTLPVVDSPEEYSRPWWRGSLPAFPHVCLVHHPDSGISVSEWRYKPSGSTEFIAGGNSMPGVNEALKAGIIGIGGVLGSIFGQSQIGGVAAEVLEPLYSDVFMAFQKRQDTDRMRKQGWDYTAEMMVPNSSRAYTVNEMVQYRKAKSQTASEYVATVSIYDGAPYTVGAPGVNGYDFWLGDRVAVLPPGKTTGKYIIQQVTGVELRQRAGEPIAWNVTIGRERSQDGWSMVLDRLATMGEGLRELGVW